MRLYQDISVQKLEKAKKEDLPLDLDQASSHRLMHVMRKKLGDKLFLFNGSGHDYLASITHMERNQCVVNIDQRLPQKTISTLQAHVGISVIKPNKMDYSIAKAVELGAAAITPIVAARSDGKLSSHRKKKKHHHWLQIIIQACEQCGRSDIPILHTTRLLKDWLSVLKEKTRLVMHPIAETAIVEADITTDVAILIGPEGGLSSEEIEVVRNNKFQSVNFGSRILRAETAPVVALSALHTLIGDFRAV